MKERIGSLAPRMVDEYMVEEIIESIYIDLHFINQDGTLGWDNEPGKYTIIIYMKEGIDSNKKSCDVMFLHIGGFSSMMQREM